MAAVLVGLAPTFALALLMLKVPQTAIVFDWSTAASRRSPGDQGRRHVVFSYIGGGPLPSTPRRRACFILAFQALPVVLMISVL